MRCLVSAFVFPFSGFPLLPLTLSFCSASSAVSGCLSALFPQLVLLRISDSLSVRAARSDEFMVLPGISSAFCFMGFVLFLRLWLAWFCSFFCRWLFSIFCVLFVWCAFFLLLGPLTGSLLSPFLRVLHWAGVSCSWGSGWCVLLWFL